MDVISLQFAITIGTLGACSAILCYNQSVIIKKLNKILDNTEGLDEVLADDED